MSDSSGRCAWVSPLCGPLGGPGGAYSGGVPRLGGAPSCPHRGPIVGSTVRVLQPGKFKEWVGVLVSTSLTLPAAPLR